MPILLTLVYSQTHRGYIGNDFWANDFWVNHAWMSIVVSTFVNLLSFDY